MSRPRIAIVGAGAWGSNHVRAAAREPRCELVAVVDTSVEALQRARSLAPAAAGVRDADAVLSDPSIDGVVIATPAASHVELAIAALAAGKHVLVEKPLGRSLAEGERLARVARASARHVLVGHLLVFHPAVEMLRDLIASDELGRVHYIHATRASVGRIRRDESVLWSLGPHDLSVLDRVLGAEPVGVSARGHCIHHEGVEDVAFVTLRYATGELAELFLSRVHPRKERTITFAGSSKLVVFDDVAAEKLRIHSKPYERAPDFTQFSEFLSLGTGDVHIPRIEMVEPLQAQLAHFVQCIEGTATPRADLDSALRGLKLLDAAQRSLALGGAVIAP